jgi:L,D-transpeptidase YcbB
MQDAVCKVLSPLVLVAAWLISPFAWSQPSPTEIQAVIARGELGELRRPGFASYRGELERFYGSIAYEPAWFDGDAPRKQANDAVNLLADAKAQGLDPADYDAPWLQARLDMALGTGLRPAEHAHVDAALTIAIFRYLSDLHRGRINPRALGWALGVMPQRSYDLSSVLRDAMTRDALTSMVTEAEPRLPIYQRLKTTLAAYRHLAQDASLEPLLEQEALQPGQPYEATASLAHLLAALGDLPVGTQVAPDRYDGALIAAVKRFQDRHGLRSDGVLGKATIAQLNVPLARRVRQIELALERLRWLPDLPPGPVVAVNVPSFKLWAFNDPRQPGPADLETNVVVGRATHTPTPVFMEDMRYVEFSPYWNVPSSILRKEMIPRLRRDPGYLAREDLEFVGRDGKVSTEVSAVTLAASLAGQLRLRQRPGPKNAVGGIKFVLPNAMDIYLHSTPAHALFARPRRDFSHGCIRVADAVALARFVLSDKAEWTQARIDEAMASGRRQTAQLSRPIPVVIFYSTVVVERDGSVLFPPDIYGYDPTLERALAHDLENRRMESGDPSPAAYAAGAQSHEVGPRVSPGLGPPASGRRLEPYLIASGPAVCSGRENRSAFEPAGAQIGEGLVGLVERIARSFGDDADLRRQAQKIDCILPRQIGDRHELPLFP